MRQVRYCLYCFFPNCISYLIEKDCQQHRKRNRKCHRILCNTVYWKSIRMGGTSLTNGADCSGFIMSVYAHFGYDLPHSSSALRGVGRGVSYAEAQPGDIICYSGHVAIYIGGGAIVHASNERDGIKISSNAAYTTILAVRRVV